MNRRRRVAKLMALASGTLLALHFTARELGADNPAATNTVVQNLYTVAAWLEAARGIVNEGRPASEPEHPIIVTSGYRTPEHNTEIGGSTTSDHPNGLAADFKVVGLTPYQVYTRLQKAAADGQLPAFDQLIWYALDDHIHVGLGSQLRGQFLLKTTEGSYTSLVSSALRQLRGYV